MSTARNDALLHLLADLSMLTKKGEKSNMNPTWGQYFDAAAGMVGFGAGAWVVGKMTYGAIVPDNAGMLTSVGAIAAGATVGALTGKFTGRLAQLVSILTRHSVMGVGHLAKAAATVSGFRSIFVDKKSAHDIYEIAHLLSGNPRFREYYSMHKSKRKEDDGSWIVCTLDAKGKTVALKSMSDEKYQEFKQGLGKWPGLLEEIRKDPITSQTTYSSTVQGVGRLPSSAAYEVVRDEQGDVVSEKWQLGETTFDDHDEFVEAVVAVHDQEQHSKNSPSA